MVAAALATLTRSSWPAACRRIVAELVTEHGVERARAELVTPVRFEARPFRPSPRLLRTRGGSAKLALNHPQGQPRMDHIVSCVQIGMIRSALVIVMALSTACDAGAPKPKPKPEVATPAPPVATPAPPAPPAPPPAPKFTHPHAVPRKALSTPDTSQASLPRHGIVVHSWGLAGDSMVAIDEDASTMRVVKNIMGEKPSDRTRKLDRKRIDDLMKVAFAAWHEDPAGDMPRSTDVRQDLIVVDGDEAFYLSGYPITTSLPGENTGRRAAAHAMSAIYKAAF